jgi:hypothetical protein
MPIRVPCSFVSLSRTGVLHPYWSARGLPRPRVDLYVIGPGGKYLIEPAQVDTAADHTLLSSGVATTLGLSLPFPRQMQISGMGGVQTAAVSFPPDGLVSLVVTDYREYAYLPRPLVGFHALSGGTTSQRSVLGLTGFLQHFRFGLDLPANPPVFELDPQAGFPGSTGTLTAGQPLADFLASLRGTV